jgi:N-acetylglucosamine-6-phosphate deacetylase
MSARRITAARALAATGWYDRVAIEVDAGRIIGLTPLAHDEIPEYDTVAPGFVDLQVNGVDDIDVALADGADWDRLDDLLASQGVTTWCPTLVTAPLHRYVPALERIRVARDRVVRDGVARPDMAGVHLEGPFLGGAPGAHPPALLRPLDLEWLAALPDHIALVTLAPELERAPEAIALLAERGVLVSLGHSTPTRAQFDAAVDAGARMVTHLFNGMSGLHHRSPGLAAFALVDERVASGLIADGVHVDPTMMRLAWQARPDGIVLVTDAVAWRAGTAGSIGLEVRDGAPRLTDGTLAGSAVTMIEAVRRSVTECSATLEQALTAASSRPAHLLGLHDRGVIAPGRRADLVALDASLDVARTWALGTPISDGGGRSLPG